VSLTTSGQETDRVCSNKNTASGACIGLDHLRVVPDMCWCDHCMDCRFLTYNPSRRITAEDGCRHDFFTEAPLPVDPSMFPTWPAKSEQSRASRSHGNSPKPPSGGKAYAKLLVARCFSAVK